MEARRDAPRPTDYRSTVSAVTPSSTAVELTVIGGDAFVQLEAERSVDADNPPRWREVADHGTYTWHDHRVHWMSTGAPGVSRGEEIRRWEIPLLVDGDPVSVEGVLSYEPAPAWWPWAPSPERPPDTASVAKAPSIS